MRFNLLFFTLLGLLSTPIFAQSAESRLNAALKNLDNLSAEFKQTVLNEDKQVVQQSRGRLAIQRPGKFLWIYTEPYEQQIIADGSELWVYDVGLEQVTVKPMVAGLKSTPIMILMQQHDIGAEFVVSEIGQRKFLYWVALDPRTPNLEYSQIYIGLEEGNIKAMELRDNFGQSTQIVFENLRLNLVQDPAIFKFVAPPGVDVFGAGS